LKYRYLWTFILLVVAFGVLFFTRSGVGLVAGIVCLGILLFIWARPRKITARSGDQQNREVSTINMSRSIFGFGFGLLAAVAAILLLPREWFFVAAAVVGIVAIVWIIKQYR
jgi:hypothetical protein